MRACVQLYSYTGISGLGWPLAPPPHVCHFTSESPVQLLALHCSALLCSPLIKRLLPGATLKCSKLMCTRVRCRLILQLTDFTVTNKAIGLIMPWKAQTGVSYLVWSNWVVSLINKLLSSFKYHWDTWGTMGTQLLNYIQTHELHAQLHSLSWQQWQEYLNIGEPVSAFISGLSCW